LRTQHRFIDGGDRTSQVPGGPQYERALLFDPGGTSARGHCCASMLPSAISTASAPARTIISRLNHTARSLVVYASQGGLPHHHARLTSGWLASLSGRELVTRKVPMKGFRSIPFSSPRLCLAHRKYTVCAGLPAHTVYFCTDAAATPACMK
jgi:hypothetical protein